MRVAGAAALMLLASPLAHAGMMFGLGKDPGNGSGYTPLCSVGPTCAYAYSTERQMVSTATTALQVERSVDGTTQNVGIYKRGSSQHRYRGCVLQCGCRRGDLAQLPDLRDLRPVRQWLPDLHSFRYGHAGLSG